MIPSSYSLLIFEAVIVLMQGAFVGIIVGLCAVVLLKTRARDLLSAAGLGAFGFTAGFLLCIFTPFPENTVYKKLPGGAEMATTTHSYQHPYRVAFAAAALLPIAYEIWRFKRRTSTTRAGSTRRVP